MSQEKGGIDPAEWDVFMRRHGGGFLQSWDWGRFQDEAGRKCVRRRVPVSGGDVGAGFAFQGFIHRGPLGFSYLYVPHGPVGLTGSSELRPVLESVREAAIAAGAAFARIETPWWTESAPVNAEDWSGNGCFRGKNMQPEHTVVVDLAPTDEQLLAAMHSKTRYNVRVAERHGVTVREADPGSEADRRAFIDLLRTTAARDRFSTHEASYYDRMIVTLAHAGSHEGACRVRLFLAEFQGASVAAALTAEFGDTVTYLHGASADEHRQVMAPFRLHWEIMRRAKSDGFRNYDLWGVAPPDMPDHAWAGITRFKSGFGGRRLQRTGTWELPIKRGWYNLYRRAKRLLRP